MVLLIIIPFLNGYFIGNIAYFQDLTIYGAEHGASYGGFPGLMKLNHEQWHNGDLEPAKTRDLFFT